MPVWVQVVLGGAALVTACGVLYRKVVRPGARLISAAEQTIPLLVELVDTFGKAPSALAVLREMASEFTPDGGSSLRDVVDRLAESAAKNRELIDALLVSTRRWEEQTHIASEVVRELAEQDRRQVRRLELVVDRLVGIVEAGGATGLRIEAAQHDVAADLAASQERADDVDSGEPSGAAADAAVRHDEDQ